MLTIGGSYFGDGEGTGEGTWFLLQKRRFCKKNQVPLMPLTRQGREDAVLQGEHLGFVFRLRVIVAEQVQNSVDNHVTELAPPA